MLKISDFSKLSHISIRMLRYYDEKDILKPLIVKDNGYRYYEYTQLSIASNITYLRYLGFSTDKIKEILVEYSGGKDSNEFLQQQLKILQQEQIVIQEKIHALTMTINKMKQEEKIMNYQVEIKEIPAMYMMCKRDIIPSYDKEYLLWQGLTSEIAAKNMDVTYSQESTTMAVFYDSGYKEQDVDVEICVEVDGKYEDTDHIKFKSIPATKVASVTYTGGYEHISDVCFCIGKWISDHDLEICGPDFSIYHVGYDKTDNPDNFVTEICYPIK